MRLPVRPGRDSGAGTCLKLRGRRQRPQAKLARSLLHFFLFYISCIGRARFQALFRALHLWVGRGRKRGEGREEEDATDAASGFLSNVTPSWPENAVRGRGGATFIAGSISGHIWRLNEVGHRGHVGSLQMLRPMACLWRLSGRACSQYGRC